MHGLRRTPVQPLLALISSVGGGGKYEFPHPLAVDATRDALRTARGPGRGELADHELGIHYTAAVTRRAGEAEPRPLGSIALMVPAKRGRSCGCGASATTVGLPSTWTGRG